MVGILDDTSIRFPIGSRLQIGDNYGTVKYVGDVKGYAGTWLGIEWDDAKRGKHDGSLDGVHYFQTRHATAGSFIRPGKVGPCESLEKAARERYHGQNPNDNLVDEGLLREIQQSFQASIFEVVGMEKIARKQSRFEQLTEISVAGCMINTAGYLKDFAALTTLNISHTLVWNWSIVGEIVSQLPMLRHLNLSCNRLQLPTDGQIAEWEPAFRNLQDINLRACGYEKWSDLLQIARLWPNIQSLGLQENNFSELSVVNTCEVFCKLRELDLHRTKIHDFDEIYKLGNIETLTCLNVMENGIEEIRLPDCEPNEKLDIFLGLEQLNLLYNPIWNEAETFNELDKLPRLQRLSMTPNMKSDFAEMFSLAVATITGLQVLNKARVTPEERRGAEYDIWKKRAPEWLLATQSPKPEDSLREFYKKHRFYAGIIKKYGSPSDFIPALAKRSNLIRLRIRNQRTGEIWDKRVPRTISVQTLQGLVVRRFQLGTDTMPQLSYIDSKRPDLVVSLDKGSKTLDYFSIQDTDIVDVCW